MTKNKMEECKMKFYTKKRKATLNPCKYCGETEIDIIYNRFNHQDYYCAVQCKCGAYVRRYCINPLIVEKLVPSVIEAWNVGDISEPIR